MEKIKFIKNTSRKTKAYEDFSKETAKSVHSFHKSFPEYKKTELVPLNDAARSLGIESLYVKDESTRFSLNAFKVLGGSYAMGRIIAEKLGIDKVDYGKLTTADAKELTKKMTFCTATDGNHGRSVAWTAKKLGAKSVVFMPKGTAEERLQNVLSEGADAKITEYNYDDTVRFAFKTAKENGFTVVQDTTAENYKEVPKMIMQGYLTLAKEIADELKSAPTHIFLQAGVGAFAGSMTAYFRNIYGDEPIISIVEPNAADCIFSSVASNDGKMHFITGYMKTVMAGLACGEPCDIGYDILKNNADFLFSVPDSTAVLGMRSLYFNKGRDKRIVSGESGAVTVGLLTALMQEEDLKSEREALGLSKTSRVLCISTEGDTDKENFKRIIGN